MYVYNVFVGIANIFAYDTFLQPGCSSREQISYFRGMTTPLQNSKVRTFPVDAYRMILKSHNMMCTHYTYIFIYVHIHV